MLETWGLLVSVTVLSGAVDFTGSSLLLFHQEGEYITLALTFSKDAGLTSEKQIKKTSCGETKGPVVYKGTGRDNGGRVEKGALQKTTSSHQQGL